MILTSKNALQSVADAMNSVKDRFESSEATCS